MPPPHDACTRELVDALIRAGASNAAIQAQAGVGASYVWKRRRALGCLVGSNGPRRPDHPWRQYKEGTRQTDHHGS